MQATWSTYLGQRRTIEEPRKPKFKLLKVIGHGGFGTVFDGIVNKKPVIIKCVPDNDNGHKEIIFLKQLIDAPGIVQYITTFIDKNFVYIIMEKIDHVIDLFEYLMLTGTIPESTTQTITKQLVNILIFCKNQGILHNDIKDTNILINPDTLQITLIDFGAAQMWQENTFYDSHAGTEFYRCPEWKTDKRYTANGMTSWQIGILVYIMLVGDIPDHELYHFDCACLEYNTNFSVSTNAKHFVSSCLQPNSESRITLDQMAYHPWINSSM